ncbi:hypothetical protein BDV28DRAFT_161285 [Aspergillus coremiiformis]|uniref:Uncharacterized protein n=1 Tax=Aspergillus coremiiformis TaxID=138285 RepID=A0A5N6YV41_9EURO|nr:hypothetical protein BDV28DRAFT_161285 [Aspergillus coremiiformis]
MIILPGFSAPGNLTTLREPIYPLAQQHQVSAPEDDVLSADDSLLPSDEHSDYSGHPPMVPSTSHPTVHQQNCHHSVIERQFCVDRMETCESCGRRPFLGWLYLCTEDTSGFSDPLDPINGPFLSPWILKAMEDGHYTTDQKEIVIHQKLNVVRMAERERGPAPPPLSMVYAERSMHDEYYQDDPWVELVEDVSQRHERSPRTSESTVHFEHTEKSSHIFQRPLPPPPCTFKACRYCERRYGNLEERTWISLNKICNDPSIPPPDSWELLERPVSDANILRNIGLRSQPAIIGFPEIGSSDHVTAEDENINARLYSLGNITSTDLHEIVNQSLNLSIGSDETERQSIESHATLSSASIVIGITISAVSGDHSAGLGHNHDEGNTGEIEQNG